MNAPPAQLGGRLCICVGAGGVGKTTVAAAIACARAAAGERVAVVTIDPAPRLAQALGFDELSGEPRRVPGAGELWAMRLDPKRTLDELISSLAPDDQTRERALSNRIYRELSGAVAGSQEFSAVAKLYELDRSGAFDAIVLDTPPSRNALDFLDAPTRLTHFFEGRALRLLLAQGNFATRAASRAGAPLLARDHRVLCRHRRHGRRARGPCGGGLGAAARADHHLRPGDLASARGARGGDRVRR
ncbi:MAG: ArsA-related P-loop ATPase [Solirubrobacteraceae bacterium]